MKSLQFVSAAILTAALAAPGYAAVDGFLFFAGGIPNVAPIPPEDNVVDGVAGSILVADVDIAAGTVGNWRRANQLLPRPDVGGVPSNWLYTEDTVHSWGGYLFVGPGGSNSAASQESNFVASARINFNGTLEPFVTSSLFPDPVDQSFGASAIADLGANGVFYYVLGGSGATGSTRVLVAPVNPDGTLGAWTTTTPLPQAEWFNRATTVQNLLIHGSGNLTSPAGRFVYTSPITASTGAIGAWSSPITYDPGATNRWDYGFVTVSSGGNDFIAIVGGTGGTGTNGANNDVRIAQVTAGTVGAFTAAPVLPGNRRRVSAAAAGDLLIVPGGSESTSSGGAQTTVYIGRVSSSGVIASWATATEPMLQARSYGGVTYAPAPPAPLNAGSWEHYD